MGRLLCGFVLVCASVVAQPVFAQASEEAQAKVTGIGGVFILSKHNGKELAAWYSQHLGMPLEGFGGVVLQWQQDTASDGGITVWGTGNPDSKWFSPSNSSFMINYRVDDLLKLVAQLAASNIPLVGGPEYHENGIFAWIMDPEGNKVELWQPMLWDDKNKRTVPES